MRAFITFLCVAVCVCVFVFVKVVQLNIILSFVFTNVSQCVRGSVCICVCVLTFVKVEFSKAM